MEDDGNNSCVICYEPLSSLPFGTTIPCGHLFHETCFSGWSARNMRRDLKCPICNGVCQRAMPFMRIFCNLETNNSGTAGGDDSSCSSDEEKEEDIGDTEIDGINVDVNVNNPVDFDIDSEGNSIHIDIESNRVDVIEIFDDDDDNDDEPRPNAASANNNNNKYKRKAKLLKRKCKHLEKQRTELAEQETKRSDQHKQLQERMKIFDDDAEEMKERSRLNHLEMEEYKLALRRCKAQLKRHEDRAHQYKTIAQKATDSLRIVQESHESQLRAAQSTSLIEVRELQTHHRELSVANQRLKEAVTHRNARIDEMKRRVQGLEHRVYGLADDSMETMEVDRRKSQKLQAKELKRFQQEKRLEAFNDVARDERKELQKRMSNKSSALAARMGRASEKRIIQASSVLDDIGNTKELIQQPNNRKRKVDSGKSRSIFAIKPPSIQIKQRKGAAPSARVDAFAKFTVTTKKRSSMLQNDIRTMWTKSTSSTKR